MDKAKTIGTWALTVLMAVAFLSAGGSKLAGSEQMVNNFNEMGLPTWFLYVTGAIEVAGALLLLIPRTSPLGAGLLIPTMIGAVLAHVVSGHPIGQAVPAAVLGLLVAAVLYLRRDELQALLPDSAAAPTTA